MTANSSSTQSKRIRNKVPVCGTYGGYNFHVRQKTTICQPCKDARNSYRRVYYKLNPHKKRAMDIRYLASHPGQRKKYDQKYRDNNRDKTRSASLKWQKEHPEKGRLAAHKRRAIKLQNGHEPYTEKQVLDLYGVICHLCDVEIDLTAPRSIGKEEGWQQGLHIDHVIPIASGGPDTIDNVRPAHALCNMKKGARMDFEPEIDPDLFDEDLLEELLEEDLVIPDDYDDHYNDDQELAEEEE